MTRRQLLARFPLSARKALKRELENRADVMRRNPGIARCAFRFRGEGITVERERGRGRRSAYGLAYPRPGSDGPIL